MVRTHSGFNLQNDRSNFAVSSEGEGMLFVINIQLAHPQWSHLLSFYIFNMLIKLKMLI